MTRYWQTLIPLLALALLIPLATVAAQPGPDSAPPPPPPGPDGAPPPPPPGAEPGCPPGPPPPMMFGDPFSHLEGLRARVLRAMALSSDDALRAALEAEVAALRTDATGLPPEAQQMLDELKQMAGDELPPEALAELEAELKKGSAVLAEAADAIAKTLDATADADLRAAVVKAVDDFVNAKMEQLHREMEQHFREMDEGDWGGG